MASTYSTLGRLEIMTQGEKDNQWGDITNTNLQLIEAMMHGFEEISLLSGNLTLSTANGGVDQARKKILKFVGATAARTVTIPAVSHEYIVWNAGTFDITVKTAAGTGATIAANGRSVIFCDGLNTNTLSGIATTPFSITLLDDPDALTARGTLGVPGLSDSSSRNIFTAEEPVQFRWADSTGSTGPSVVIARDSATPQAGDACGALKYRARNTAAAMTLMHELAQRIVDPTAGSEDSELRLKSIAGGALDDCLFVGPGGVRTFGSTSDHGRGTFDAEQYFASGSRVYPNVGYAILEHRLAAGTDGGTATGGSWLQRALNTETLDIGGIVTLTANQFELAAGSYYIRATGTFFQTASTRLRIRNMTDGTTAVVGINGYSNDGGTDPDEANVHLAGGFTIAGTKTFELQYRTQSTQVTDGLGNATGSWSEDEVFAQVEITKIA